MDKVEHHQYHLRPGMYYQYSPYADTDTTLQFRWVDHSGQLNWELTKILPNLIWDYFEVTFRRKESSTILTPDYTPIVAKGVELLDRYVSAKEETPKMIIAGDLILTDDGMKAVVSVERSIGNKETYHTQDGATYTKDRVLAAYHAAFVREQDEAEAEAKLRKALLKLLGND